MAQICSYVAQICFFHDSANSTNHIEFDLFESCGETPTDVVQNTPRHPSILDEICFCKVHLRHSHTTPDLRRLRIHTHLRTEVAAVFSPHPRHLLTNPLASTTHHLINETTSADFSMTCYCSLTCSGHFRTEH